MQNQPFATVNSDALPEAAAAGLSQGRLMLLAILLIGIVCLIAGRVYYIQVVIADEFLVPWRKTHIVEVSIPARNGRILSRDGVVLAYDQTRYDIAVEYRWLEVPFDEVWLRQQTYARLSDEERDQPERRRQIKQELEQERSQLLHRLAELSGISTSELQHRAGRLQKRIERMVVAVERNRSQESDENELQPLSLQDGVAGMAKKIKAELTTPPRRYSTDPVILKEELESHPLINDVPLQVVAVIQSSPNQFPGVHVLSNSARVYPLDDVACHLIGIRKPLSPQQPAIGQGGIEQQYHSQLMGQPGKSLHHLNRRGEVVAHEVSETPHDGTDTLLSLDSRLQRTAEKLLDQALDNEEAPSHPVGGVVVIMDLWTGDLLAAATAPRYSLQTMLHPTVEELQALKENPNQPFFPRTTRMALPPGSVFKIVTAAAALEEGKVSPDEILECRGYLNSPTGHRCKIFRDYGIGHGEIHLQDAICQSCNVFFYDLAQRLGPDSLVDWSQRFGFGMPTGIDLPAEESGRVPSPSDPSQGKQWYPGSTLQLSIGQGSLLATPLQVTRLMAAIGNGGYLVNPRLVSKKTSEMEVSGRSLVRVQGLSEKTVFTIRQGMEMVVNHSRGTGIAALTPSMTIAAKTGTAEVDGQADHAWFAGYAPVESPRVAFCVVLEHGGSGGDAGPIVKHLMTEMLGLGYLQPQWDEKSTRSNNESRPAYVNAERDKLRD